MPIDIIITDITTLDTDAIVNAANEQLLAGGGVCGAIFKAAGKDKLQEACNKIGHCDVGNAVITEGFDLKAKYVIHTVGPIYGQDPANEENQLYSCYKNSLELAKNNSLESIAFPLISSGIYGYPKKEAMDIAIKAARDFLEDNEMDISLVIYNKDDLPVDEKLHTEIEEYINKLSIYDTYETFSYIKEGNKVTDLAHVDKSKTERIIEKLSHVAQHFYQSPSLDEIIKTKHETFSQMLLRLIDEKGMTDSEVYKKANVSRSVFSKIRQNHIPSRNTVIAFVIALKLDIQEARELLQKAGYAFTGWTVFDSIIERFIEQKFYDIDRINIELASYDLPLLGSKTRE